MVRKKSEKSKEATFGVGLCSMCDRIAVTFGEQSHGGVRYCKDDIRFTFGWFQLSDEHKQKTDNTFDRLTKEAEESGILNAVSEISPEHRKALSIGEATYRLMMSQKE